MMIATKKGFRPLTVEDVVGKRGDLGWQNDMYCGCNNYVNYPKRVEAIPKWVESIEGFAPQVFICMKNPVTYIVNYMPTTVLGVGFSNIVIVDKKGNPFKQMKPILKKVKKSVESSKEPEALNVMPKRTYRIDDDGRITGPFGIMDTHDVGRLIDDIMPYYRQWRKFPEAKSWSMVEKLTKALEQVKVLKREIQTKDIEGEIEEARESIQNMQKRIQMLEKHQNEMYEKAADAMNILEENGVKIDLNDGKNDIDDYDTTYGFGDIPIITDIPTGSMFDSSSMFIEHNGDDLCTSSSPSIPIHFDKEQMKQLREEIAKGLAAEIDKQILSQSPAWDIQYASSDSSSSSSDSSSSGN